MSAQLKCPLCKRPLQRLNFVNAGPDGRCYRCICKVAPGQTARFILTTDARGRDEVVQVTWLWKPADRERALRQLGQDIVDVSLLKGDFLLS